MRQIIFVSLLLLALNLSWVFGENDWSCPPIGTAEGLNTDNEGGVTENPVGERKCVNDRDCNKDNNKNRKCCNTQNGGTKCTGKPNVAEGAFQMS